jgi:hypothetical protein
MTTNQQLGLVRRSRRKFDRAKEDLERAILAADEAGISLRLIAIAAGAGKSSIHRLIVRARS